MLDRHERISIPGSMFQGLFIILELHCSQANMRLVVLQPLVVGQGSDTATTNSRIPLLDLPRAGLRRENR